MRDQPPVRWAARVSPHKIRRLYEQDALGVLDEDLLDEVGYGLYSRCRSILHVTDAMNGKVHCPACDAIIEHHGSGDTVLVCASCGWQTRWEAYAATYRNQELGAGGAADMFSAFLRQWEAARTAREKMIAIDVLIHRWHWETAQQRPSFGLGRPTGVNLIEGNRKQVLALLDALTYGDRSTPGLQTTKTAWRDHWNDVQQRQRADRARRGNRSSADKGE